MKVTRSLFVQVPVWMIDHPDLTPTALRVYLALGVEALAGDVRARRAPKDVTAIMRGSGLRRSAVYEALAALRAMGAVVERRGGDLFLPLDDPSATADDPTLNLTPTPSVTVDKPSATVESASTVAESESATVDSSSCKRIREPRERTPAAGAEGVVVPEVVDPVHDAAHRLAVLAFEQDPRPVTPFPAVLTRCREALDAGWSEAQVGYVIRAGDVAAWTREALQLALNRRRQAADARRGGQVSAMSALRGMIEAEGDA